MPRPRKPTPLKILDGSNKKNPTPKDEPIYDPSIPEPPEHLTDYALEEWERISKMLYPLGLLTDADRAAMAGYCQSYGRWRLAEEQLQKTPGLVIETQSGNLIQNPLVGIANKAMEHMRKFITLFGLSPADRTRVSVDKQNKTENRFEKYK